MVCPADGVPLKVRGTFVVVGVPTTKFEYVAVPPVIKAPQFGATQKVLGKVGVTTGFEPLGDVPTVSVHVKFDESPEQAVAAGPVPHPDGSGRDGLLGRFVKLHV